MPTTTRQKLLPWALFVGAVAILLSIAVWALPARPIPAQEAAPAAVVLARGGDSTVTVVAVEALVSAEIQRLDNERYEALNRGLNDAIADRLVKLEAAARDVTVEELLEAEVEGKVAEVTQAEVDAFYEGRKAQIRATKEQVEPQIRQYLAEQRQGETFQAFVAGLDEKYGVERLLEPPRIDVAHEGFPAKGPQDAPVTIVEFSDFECPYCSRVLPTLEQVVANYEDSVRVVFRQFPLNSIHARAQKAAEASLCADDQGKFWEMHDAMFARQKELAVPNLKEMAAELSLDAEAFASCLDGSKYAEQVAADLEAGQAAGVSGTPAMFINGRFVNGAVPYEALAAIVDEELRRASGS
jgi:protein-disulfide isomerase